MDDEAMALDERIRRSKQIYRQAGDAYERVRFNPDNGGFVLVHWGHNRGESYESELFVAQVLANQGRRVTLLNEMGMGAGVKTPDADIDGNLADFKRLTQTTQNVAARVQEGFLTAKKQGVAWVVYHLDRDSTNISRINRGLASAFLIDRKGKIQRVTVVFNEISTKTLTREEWLNGQRI
ncbi:hypothetical protein [Gloeomargarita lithophora]|uniref:CdiA C-terminal domain-containing protein n=1 Tax=Gloeomargarita lithophora TaxID=1188228 RepID=UPI0012FDF975|nr:hypothetical protein [Gloeomargarita lithophora]